MKTEKGWILLSEDLQKPVSKKAAFVTGKFERYFYGQYFLGQLIFYGIVTGFLSLYLTDMGIPALVVSGIYAIAKVWDAVNDPMFGVIVDKAKLKKGRYIPWVRLSTFLIPVTTIFMFAIPSSVSVQVKTLWSLGAYILWSVGYTICDVPIFALATSMTDNIIERDWLYLINRIFTFFGALAVLVFVPLFYPRIGWSVTIAIMSVLAFATMLPIGYTAKERFFTRDEKEESPSIGKLIRYVAKNKYLLIFNGAVIVFSLTNTASVVGNYVAIYCLGGPEWITIISLVSAVPMLLSVLITQQLIKRIDKRTVFIVSIAVLIVLNVVTYFVGYKNVMAYIVLTVIKSLFFGAIGVLQVIFTADCAEYGNFVSGERAQGIAFSIQTFTAKLTAALSGTVGMMILGLIGFVEGEGAVQTADTIEWIWRLNTIVPVISALAAFFILLFGYQLRTPDVELMMRVNKGELTREEAEKGFSRQYT